EMYVILLDNGRTNLYQRPDVREALYCIRCGACLNACPVYKNIGGHAYGTTYSGPIGSVITPHLTSFEENQHLSYASSLCGACTAACPVKINIHGMLLINRTISVEEKMNSRSEGFAWRIWRRGMLSRRLMNSVGSGMKNMMLNRLFGATWLHRRGGTEFAPRAFQQLWKERQKQR
ncbi:MAG: 4Fe-4S dicluster domain-containing protein, partial [Chitinophagaceae bacterium]